MTRALVLGGGGPVGIGWEAGLVAGLADGGVDVGTADEVVGTSAGSFVGALLTSSLDLHTTVDRLVAVRPPVDAPGIGGASLADRMQLLMDAVMRAASATSEPDETLRELGRLALENPGVEEEEFVRFFEVLAGVEWPEQFACTAVDAERGEFVVWRADSGVDLQRGVASSCSVPCVYAPVTIHGRRYVDGGMRDGLNPDVAAGHDAVVAVSCMALELPEGITSPMFDAMVGRTMAQLDGLRQDGAKVELITPSPEFLELSGWGASLMDASKAEAAYQAGRRHGLAEAERVGAIW